MIFQAEYKDLQKPMARIRALLSDADYKSDIKRITLEATQANVMIHYVDERLGLNIKAIVEDASIELAGKVTCTFASLNETLKVFKKSDESLMLEREEDILRIDDGVYPEEVLMVQEDEPLNDWEMSDKVWATVPAEALKTGIQSCLPLLRKSDIPETELDTQAVYLMTSDSAVEVTAFALHSYHHAIFPAQVEKENRLIGLPKAIATVVAKLMEATASECPSWILATVEKANGRVFQLSDGEGFDVAIEQEMMVTEERLRVLFHSLTQNFRESMQEVEQLPFSGTSEIGKVKASDNLVLADGKPVMSPVGFPAMLIKRAGDKGAISAESSYFHPPANEETAQLLCFYEKKNGIEKMTAFGYRGEPIT